MPRTIRARWPMAFTPVFGGPPLLVEAARSCQVNCCSLEKREPAEPRRTGLWRGGPVRHLKSRPGSDSRCRVSCSLVCFPRRHHLLLGPCSAAFLTLHRVGWQAWEACGRQSVTLECCRIAPPARRRIHGPLVTASLWLVGSLAQLPHLETWRSAVATSLMPRVVVILVNYERFARGALDDFGPPPSESSARL